MATCQQAHIVLWKRALKALTLTNMVLWFVAFYTGHHDQAPAEDDVLKQDLPSFSHCVIERNGQWRVSKNKKYITLILQMERLNMAWRHDTVCTCDNLINGSRLIWKTLLKRHKSCLKEIIKHQDLISLDFKWHKTGIVAIAIKIQHCSPLGMVKSPQTESAVWKSHERRNKDELAEKQYLIKHILP